MRTVQEEENLIGSVRENRENVALLSHGHSDKAFSEQKQGSQNLKTQK